MIPNAEIFVNYNLYFKSGMNSKLMIYTYVLHRKIFHEDGENAMKNENKCNKKGIIFKWDVQINFLHLIWLVR